MTKAQMKRGVREALRNEYGFAPAVNQITILESNGEGTHVLFEVGGEEYSFNSHNLHFSDGIPAGVWVGKGTIEKTGFRYDRISGKVVEE